MLQLGSINISKINCQYIYILEMNSLQQKSGLQKLANQPFQKFVDFTLDQQFNKNTMMAMYPDYFSFIESQFKSTQLKHTYQSLGHLFTKRNVVFLTTHQSSQRVIQDVFKYVQTLKRKAKVQNRKTEVVLSVQKDDQVPIIKHAYNGFLSRNSQKSEQMKVYNLQTPLSTSNAIKVMSQQNFQTKIQKLANSIDSQSKIDFFCLIKPDNDFESFKRLIQDFEKLKGKISQFCVIFRYAHYELEFMKQLIKLFKNPPVFIRIPKEKLFEKKIQNNGQHSKQINIVQVRKPLFMMKQVLNEQQKLLTISTIVRYNRPVLLCLGFIIQNIIKLYNKLKLIGTDVGLSANFVEKILIYQQWNLDLKKFIQAYRQSEIKRSQQPDLIICEPNQQILIQEKFKTVILFGYNIDDILIKLNKNIIMLPLRLQRYKYRQNLIPRYCKQIHLVKGQVQFMNLEQLRFKLQRK